MGIVGWIVGCIGEWIRMLEQKESKVMRAGTSTKSSSVRRSADKAAKASVKRSSRQKSKWKVVDGRVEVSPGDYSIEDLEAMLKAVRQAFV